MLAPAPVRSVPAPDLELRVAVPGGKVHVRVNGRVGRGRPPLLLAHGGPGSCHASLVPALALAADRAVILYDQLDCGRSDRPGDPANWTVARFVAEVAAIRDALGLGRFHFLGHSWGATIALEHAAAHPRDLASLILMGPLISTAAWLDDAARLRSRLPGDVRRTLDACEGVDPPSPVDCLAATRVFYDRHWRLRDPSPAVIAYEDAMPHRFTPALYETMWGPTEFRATGTLARYDATALLDTLAHPTLVLIGEHDEVTRETAARFVGRIPGGAGELAMIPDAAHRIQSDRTDLFLATLHAWMQRHDGDAA